MIRYAVFAFAVVVPDAVPEPDPGVLSCPDATIKRGVVPASDGT